MQHQLSDQLAKQRRTQGLIEKIAKSNIQLNRWAMKRDIRNLAQGNLDSLRKINDVSKRWLVLLILKKVILRQFRPFKIKVQEKFRGIWFHLRVLRIVLHMKKLLKRKGGQSRISRLTVRNNLTAYSTIVQDKIQFKAKQTMHNFLKVYLKQHDQKVKLVRTVKALNRIQDRGRFIWVQNKARIQLLTNLWDEEIRKIIQGKANGPTKKI